jgi:transcriptional regulator with XRE-family HTH domain
MSLSSENKIYEWREYRQLRIEEAFGIVLKKYRLDRELSQEKLSLFCGLDRTFISLLERGKRKPTINTVFIIASIIGVNPSRIISEVEDLVNTENKNLMDN